MLRRLTIAIRTWLIPALIALVYSNANAQVVFTNPFGGSPPEEYSRAKIAFERIGALPNDQLEKFNWQFQFSTLETIYSTMRSETNPIFLSISRYRDKEAAWFKDRDAYSADKKAYEDDCDAYVAAGGGGTYDVNDPKYAMLVAWHGRLTAWKGRLDEWMRRVNSQVPELNSTADAIKNGLAIEYSQWKRGCANYAEGAEKFLARAEIEKKLVELRQKLSADKRELARFTQLPGLYADIEKMAQDAEQAREDGAVAALDEMTGFALDALTEKVKARAKLAQGKLAEIQRILKKYGVRDSDVGLVLKNHAGATVTREHELLEQLGKLRNVASAYDSTTKKQYMLAIASLLETFVEWYPFKLAITNFKVYSNLFYTGASYTLTRARVNQYNKLSEQQLIAVSKISELYKKHLKEEKKLKEELAALG